MFTVPILFIGIVFRLFTIFIMPKINDKFATEPKVISEVLVLNVKYEPSYTDHIFTGKTFVPITHSSKYYTYFKYNDIDLYSTKKEVYDLCKDSVGSYVFASLDYSSVNGKTTVFLREVFLEVKDSYDNKE